MNTIVNRIKTQKGSSDNNLKTIMSVCVVMNRWDCQTDQRGEYHSFVAFEAGPVGAVCGQV